MTFVVSNRVCSVLFSALISLLVSSSATGQTFDLDNQTLAVGDVYILEDEPIFVFHKAELIDSTSQSLDELATFLLKFPAYQFEVQFHNDTRGGPHYSTNLSQKRAETIKAYLLERGVPDHQLVARGMGESEPFISDDDIAKMRTAQEKEEAHSQNRRVQILVVARLVR